MVKNGSWLSSPLCGLPAPQYLRICIIETQNDVKTYFYKRIGFNGHAASVQMFKAGQSYYIFSRYNKYSFLDESYFPGKEPFFYDMSILELIKRAGGIPVILLSIAEIKDKCGNSYSNRTSISIFEYKNS